MHFPTHQNKATSLFGFDLTRYVEAPERHRGRACDIAVRALTHGGIYPIEQAIEAIGLYDRAALAVLETYRELEVQSPSASADPGVALAIYVNTLGRLHIRPASLPNVVYSEDDKSVDLGWVAVTPAILAEIEARHAVLEQAEAEAFVEVKTAVDRLHANGELASVLEEVMDHIEHVESVGFYVGDRFLALIDRYVNLIDGKESKGFLTALRHKPYAQWDADEVLVVAALHALFLSGRSVRFEEFNGSSLTARRVLARLHDLSEGYRRAGCEVEMPDGIGLFERAMVVREQTLRAPGKPWLRYRWIYGLNFQKTERIMESTAPNEPDDAWLQEFGEDYRELVSDHGAPLLNEHVAMMLLANACLARDVASVKCDRGSNAVNGWLEYLIEKVVASAVRVTNADYGMSSSLRDITRLVTYDEATLVEQVHKLTPAHFFTCFVSNNMVERLGEEEAAVIASSVQKRMMFNRWHFIPGNLERPLVRPSRHWYYPPLIPDIAIHSDMHRAAHNRARVKYSIRCPGPDMSRPPLNIARERYRGFYDVRVVRMEGAEFALGDILLTRRRTLWLESVYVALTTYLMSPRCKRLEITGFQAGTYYDIPASYGAAKRTAPVAVRETSLEREPMAARGQPFH
jgi:hypothetical protein